LKLGRFALDGDVPQHLVIRSKSERPGSLNCLREIAVLVRFCVDLTRVLSDFGSAERRPAPTGAIELPNFFKML
jgi:hypothetical protein